MYIMATLTEKEALQRSRATCLENVKNLNCWGSDLVDISIIRKMVNLQVLNLSANNISSLKDVAYCPRLKELYLRRNQIKSIEEVKYLKNLRHLNVLWLVDNPCSIDPSYREIIVKNLTNLRKLDSHEITQEERNIVNTKSIMKFDDTDLPNFDNLNLNKTLTLNEVRDITINVSSKKFARPSSSTNGHVSMFSKPATQRYEEQKMFTDEIHSSVDLNASNQMRKELGLSPLKVDSTNKRFDDKEASRNASIPRNNSSNTLNAIMILTNDLNINELKDLSSHVNNLLDQQSQRLHSSCKIEQEDDLLVS